VSFTIADNWLPSAAAMIRKGRKTLTCLETSKIAVTLLGALTRAKRISEKKTNRTYTTDDMY
jgi:hypothetical protein